MQRTSRPKRVFHKITAAVLVVGLVVTFAVHTVSTRAVRTDEDRLLRQETTLTGATFSTLINQIGSGLESTAAVAAVTNGDPAAFTRMAKSAALGFMSGSALLHDSAERGWQVAASAGTPRRPLADPTEIARLDGVKAGSLALLGFLGSGSGRVFSLASRSSTNPDYLVYAEVPLPEGTNAGTQDNDLLSRLSFAIYLGDEESTNILFTNAATLPIDGRRAVATLSTDAQTMEPRAVLDSKPGHARAKDGQLLLVTAPNGSLAGDLAHRLPWILVVITLLGMLAVAFMVEAILRRRDQALRLVDRFEAKNAALDRALIEQERAERELRESEERFRAIIAGSPDVMMSVDLSTGTTELLNRETFFGHRLETLQAEGAFDELIHPDDQQRVRDLAELLRQGRRAMVETECRIRTADDLTEWVRSRLKVLERDESGAPQRLLAIVTLISDERRAREEREHLQDQLRRSQRIEAVGRLAGGIAHDFNNLLAVIISYTGFVLDDLEADHPARADIEEVARAARRAAELTGQLLSFSRRQATETTALDLNETVETMERILERTLGEQITLSVELDSALPAVRADSGELEQVLMNLAVNARDAMSPAGGQLTIRTESVVLDDGYASQQPEVAPGHYARLTVSDTGCGMEPEVVARAFEPFFTTKAPGKGTGMGLATAYGIVTRYRGHIAVYSEPGRGTVVRVLLPADSASARPPAEAEARPRREQRPSSTVLVVEDEEAVRRAAQRILERGGYRVLVAESGPEALDRFRSADVDLVLTDVVMPGGLTGPELAERLQELKPDVRVAYMSGYDADMVTRRGEVESGVTLVEKPFTEEALLDALDGLQAQIPAGNT